MGRVTGASVCLMAGTVASGLAVFTLRWRIPPSSLIARSAMSGGRALPCQPSLFSISEKPLPLTVLAMITVGLPVADSAVDRGDVMAVDDDRETAERLHAAPVGVERPAVFGLAALAEAVDVEDCGQVGQLVKAGLVKRLPDRALGELRVAA